MGTRSFLLAIGLSFLAVSSRAADEDPQALTLLVAHADAVVAATSVESHQGMRSGGANHVVESFKDVVTLSGGAVPETLQVNFARWGADDPTPFKPGQRFILFLRHYYTNAWYWELSDNFLGCQPYTHGLELGVNEAAKTR